MTDRRKPGWKGNVVAVAVSTLLCVVLIEGSARIFEGMEKGKPVREMQLDMQPYMMFVSSTDDHPTWRNIITSTDVPSRMTFNNLYFNFSGDFTLPLGQEFIGRYGKKPDEKLVLITGGSAVHGVGATSNEKTTAGQLEARLNAAQSTQKYRVLNLAMGSWIAYQEFVGLSLFGLPLKPDWVVVMDGHNDGAVACISGSGAANPMNWPLMLYLTGGGEGAGPKSALVQWLIDNTSIGRVITGARPPKPNPMLDRITFDDAEPDKRFVVKMRDLTMSVLDKQVDFYLQSQRNVTELFSSANILLSSQPLLAENVLSASYRSAFEFGEKPEAAAAGKERLKADLDQFMKQNGDTSCNSGLTPQILSYFMARSALRLEKAASEWAAQSTTRSIRYSNVDIAFPGSARLREPNFIDNVHLTDLGQKRTAELFAGYILETDLKIPFSPAAFAQAVTAEATKAAGELPPSKFAYSPPAQVTPPIGGNRILEGLSAEERSPGALQLSETKDTGAHRILWASVPVKPGKNTMAVDVWSDAIPVVRLEVLDNKKSYGRADLDLDAKKILAKDGNKVDAQVQDLGKGWKRTTLTLPLAGEAATLSVALIGPGGVLLYPGRDRSIVITEPALSGN